MEPFPKKAAVSDQKAIKSDDKKAENPPREGTLFQDINSNGTIIINIQGDFISMFKALVTFKQLTQDSKDILAISENVKIKEAVTVLKTEFNIFEGKFKDFTESLINNPAEILLDHLIKGKIYWINFYELEFKRSIQALLTAEYPDRGKIWGDKIAVKGELEEAFNKITKCYHEIWNHFLENGVHVRVYGIDNQAPQRNLTDCNIM